MDEVGRVARKMTLALSAAPRAEAATTTGPSALLDTVAVAVPEALVRREDCRAPFRLTCTSGRERPCASRTRIETGRVSLRTASPAAGFTSIWRPARVMVAVARRV